MFNKDKLVKIESKLEAVTEKIDSVYHRMFFSDGKSKSVVSSIDVHDGDIKENREAIVKLEMEVKQKFDRISDKLDDIQDSMHKASVFNVINILESIFSFSKSRSGMLIRFVMIVSVTYAISPNVSSFFRNTFVNVLEDAETEIHKEEIFEKIEEKIEETELESQDK